MLVVHPSVVIRKKDGSVKGVLSDRRFVRWLADDVRALPHPHLTICDALPLGKQVSRRSIYTSIASMRS